MTTRENSVQPVEGVAGGTAVPVSIAAAVTVTDVATHTAQTDGTQTTKIMGVARGAHDAGEVTSTSEGTDHRALDTQLWHNGKAISPATEATVSAAEVHLGSIDTNVGLVEGHISTIDTNTAATEVHAGSIDTNLGLVEGHISTIDTSMGLVEGHISTIDTNMGLVEGHISTIDTNVGLVEIHLADGTQIAQVRSGAKGVTAAAAVTSTDEGANNQALDVQIYHGSAAINPTAIRALTTSDEITAVGKGTAGSPNAGVMTVQGITSGTAVIVGGPAADDAAASGNPALVGGVCRTSPTADPIDDGDVGAPLLNTYRMLVAALGQLIHGEDETRDLLHVNHGGTYVQYTAAADHVVKSGAGALFRIIVTKVAAGSSLTAYDNTSATSPVILNTFATTSSELNSNVPHVIECGIDFATGLTITSVGSVEFTVVYR